MPQRCVYTVGQRVVYTPAKGRALLATIRFVGTIDPPTERTDRVFVGLETDNVEPGRHDGYCKRDREQHFRCATGHGLYVPANTSRLRPAAATATQQQQKLALGLEAQCEFDTLRFARAARSAEASIRASHAQPEYRKCWDVAGGRYLFYDRSQPLAHGLRTLPRGGVVVSTEGGPDAPPAPGPEYTGPQLPSVHMGVVSPEEARAVFEHCTTRWDEPLHSSVLLPLVRAARERFAKENTVQRLSVPRGGRLVVVGDTHGHLKDLVHIWRTQGLPGNGTSYLFNGDICDRADADYRGGQQAVHIWSCVLSAKLAFPDSVFMNRGNHEDGSYWPGMGGSSFSNELKDRYGGFDGYTLETAFADLCDSLPLGAAIDGRCMVVHGGLPRNCVSQRGKVTLAEMERLRRPLSMPCDPYTRDEGILYDMCWSDPQGQVGVGANPRGGSIISYGPDVAQKFLHAAGFGMLIRSHEVPGRQEEYEGSGFEWWHPIADVYRGCPQPEPLSREQVGWCVTVFSASDYCGCFDSNKASVVVFTGDVRTWKLVEHSGLEAEATLLSVPAARPVDTARLAEHQSMCDGLLYRELIERIIEHKHRLLAEFARMDTEYDWHLTVPDWAACCEKVLPEIPWEDLSNAPDIVPVDEDTGKVNFNVFLTRYQIRFVNKLGKHAGMRRQLTDHLFESLLRADRSIRDTFDQVDVDGDGTVSSEEFAQALASSGQVLPHAQAQALYRTVFGCSGSVRVADFLGHLSVRFALTHAKATDASDAFAPAQLDRIGREILDDAGGISSKKSVSLVLTEWFQVADKSKTGYLEPAELVEALRPLKCCSGVTDEQLYLIGRYMDYNDDGRINYLELLSALSVRRDDDQAARRAGPTALLEDVLEAVYRIMRFEYTAPLRSVLRHTVVPGTTKCTREAFGTILSEMNRTSRLLSESQIRCLVDTLDTDSSGCFDFEDFFDSFEIVDTLAEEDEEGSA